MTLCMSLLCLAFLCIYLKVCKCQDKPTWQYVYVVFDIVLMALPVPLSKVICD